MRRALIWLVGILAFIGTGWITIYSGWTGSSARQIEQKIATKAATALAKVPNAQWADISVDGRSIILSGTAPNPQAQALVVNALKNAAGSYSVFTSGVMDVRIEDTRIADTSSAPVQGLTTQASTTTEEEESDENTKQTRFRNQSPYRIRIDYRSGLIRLADYLPSEGDRQVVKAVIEDTFPDLRFYDDSYLASGAPDRQWTDMVVGSVKVLSAFEDGFLTVENNRVLITGTSSQSGADQVAIERASALPGSYDITLNMSVAGKTRTHRIEPTIKPIPLPDNSSAKGSNEKTLRSVDPSKGAKLDLSSPSISQSTQTKLPRPAAASPPEVEIPSPTKITENITPTQSQLNKQRGSQDVSVEIAEDTDASGLPPAPEYLIDAPTREAAPSSTSQSPGLRTGPAVNPADSINSDDTASQTEVIIPAPVSPITETLPSSGGSDGKSEPAFANAPASEPAGKADTKSATSADVKAQGQLVLNTNDLKSPLGPPQWNGYTAIPKQRHLFDRATCENEVTLLIAQQPLGFAPSSTDLLPEHRPILAAIADVMSRCSKYEFELIGYTENTGQDIVNQALNQERVEAVKALLLAYGANASQLEVVSDTGLEFNNKSALPTPTNRVELHLVGMR